jgi:hypothetical protein
MAWLLLTLLAGKRVEEKLNKKIFSYAGLYDHVLSSFQQGFFAENTTLAG